MIHPILDTLACFGLFWPHFQRRGIQPGYNAKASDSLCATFGNRRKTGIQGDTMPKASDSTSWEATFPPLLNIRWGSALRQATG